MRVLLGPVDRLSTTDDQGNRVYLYIADVQGFWNRRRQWLGIGLILFFLILPWISMGGAPAIWINIVERQFSFLGLKLWAHDTPLLFFLVVALAFGIGFMTSVWGRVWCGWVCPQTVFIEQIFRKIERWIEGNALHRKTIDTAAWDFKKVTQKTLKWFLFLCVTLILSHTFLAYFVSVDALRFWVLQSPLEHPIAFGVMMVLTLAMLFDLGWFREQFCIALCPYGRIQSVLMDEHSMVVAYDTQRGEPRRTHHSSQGIAGDCVDCERCIQVCPTGIDIRRGAQQLECIACTSCMDACDEVMRRLKKPLGLIRYMQQGNEWIAWFQRPRAWVYLSLLVFSLVSLIGMVAHRASFEMMLVRTSGAPYEIVVQEPCCRLVNHFQVDVRNQSFEPQRVSFSLPDEPQMHVIVTPKDSFFAPGELKRLAVMIEFPKNVLQSGSQVIKLKGVGLEIKTGKSQSVIQEVHLVGPLR